LVEQSKLHYTDSLATFFPDFPASLKKITIQQLLNHTSGIIDYSFFINKKKIITSENVITIIKKKELVFNPGDSWQYSNSGYVLLARIIELVSKEDYPNFISSHIFHPLNMTHSFLRTKQNTTKANSIHGYRKVKTIFKPINLDTLDFVYGAGHLFSTVEDLYLWDQALQKNTLVKKETFNELFKSDTLDDGTQLSYKNGWG